MKKILEYFIKKRRPDFQLAEKINNYEVLEFSFQLVIDYARSILIYRVNPLNFSIFGKGVKLKNRRFLSLGNKARIGDYVYIDALGESGAHIGESVTIGAFSRIVVSSSYSNLGYGVQLGNNVGIGEFSRLGGSGGVSIGNNTIIGQYLSCHPENHNFNELDELIRLQGTVREPIVVGNNCWLGAKVTICAGVTIGDGCVIAAGAVVTKSFPENSIIGGVPARLIGKRGL